MTLEFSLIGFILWLCFVPVIGIMHGSFKGAKKPRVNMLFGVSFPLTTDFENDEDIKKILKDFDKTLNLTSGLLFFVSLIFIVKWHYFSIMVSVYMLYLFAVCFIYFFIYANVNKQLKLLKKSKNWSCGTKKVVLADTSANYENGLKVSSKIKLTHFIPVVILNVISLYPLFIYSNLQTVFLYTIIFLAVIGVALPIGFYLWLKSIPNKVYSDDTTINNQINNERKGFLCAIMLYSGYFMGILNIIISLSFTETISWFLMISATILLTFALFGITFFYLYKYNKLMEYISHFTKKELIHDAATDEDENWIWGLVYYNKNDKRTLVEGTLPISTTMNLATKSGKFWIGFSVVVVALCFVLIGGIVYDDFVPPKITFSNEASNEIMKIDTVFNDCTIELDKIKNITLIDELPSMGKSNGTADDRKLYGEFYNKDNFTIQAFVFKESKPYLRIEYEDFLMFFSQPDPEETMKIYEELTSKIGAK